MITNTVKPFCDSSGSDMAEDECNMVENQPNWLQPEVVVGEKRLRSSSDDILDEDGFTTVRSKRSVKISKKSSVLSDVNLPPAEKEKILVSMTSKETLPKQFKMAKLLRKENILNISNIQYKSPFKIVIEFENKESTEKLLECKNITDMGIKCQLLNEMSLSYGIIRNVDLDVLDEEIKDNLESDFEIVSLRRLNRMTSAGKWVESETIRIGFKGSILPAYVRGYGYRFKVEPYMYPVTQCTGCWKFGHSIRFCPNKKIICPKCTDYHPNCEVSNYKCVNCKGGHMALDKSCPVFLKEKNIRIIMRDLNYTYRKALSIYLKENEFKKTDDKSQQKSTSTEFKVNYKKTGRSYKDVLVNQPDIHKENQESSDEEEQQGEEITGITQRVQRSKKSRTRNKNNAKTKSNDVTVESDTSMSMKEQDDNIKSNEKTKSAKKKGSRITFITFLKKIERNIYI